MSRQSTNEYDAQGRLLYGYDYERQVWVSKGRYVRCGHPETQRCQCYGRLHEGEAWLAPITVAAESLGDAILT